MIFTPTMLSKFQDTIAHGSFLVTISFQRELKLTGTLGRAVETTTIS